MKTPSDTQRAVGRPREFDYDQVMDAAIRQFTLNGYHGSSISLLSQATGLTAGSLYKAFNDKRDLFLAALTRYVDINNQRLESSLSAAGDGMQHIRILLDHYLANSNGETGRLGCLVVTSASELASGDPEIAAQIARLMKRYHQRFVRYLQQGIEDGSVRADLDPQATASLLLAVSQGLRVLGKSGFSLQQADDIRQSILKLTLP
ncbi:hypothetical protein HA49_12125 [Tatumella morbirosei]|uniref:HTH tetR-type domain-containing protein n=1 Tax=Tatumella morbirosei TaxID=642227 RepID=A0A095UET2_9GAMM|nr:TetR/AcrR family transcriptional regulator [Tatumella morbirosei]KGD72953.1 hypothetical protein HA49_12125 [Tatumella morbirosei]